MKRQPKWIAALFAVLLALCGIHQTVRAQTTEVPVVRTYHVFNEENRTTIVLRLKQQGQVYAVYGAWTSAPPETPLIYVITGTFYPNKGKLEGNLRLPPGLKSELQPAVLKGTVDGTYDAGKDTFSLNLNYSINGKPATPHSQTNIRGLTGNIPFLVGAWQWSAASSAALLASAPTYTGEFYILRQYEDGSFIGAFSGTPRPGDDRITDGKVSPEGVVFKRSGIANGTPLEQDWRGQVTQNSLSIQGGIKQTKPAPWEGEFFARWDVFR